MSARENEVEDGYHVKGRSTLVNAEGEVVLEWIKTAKDQAVRLEQMSEWLTDWLEPIQGRSRRAKRPRSTCDDLLSVYAMGDPHMGLYAWGEEVGDDFDLDIGSRDLVIAGELLVESSPPSRTAHIINAGDFYHSDNASNRTSRSGHALDVDGRFAKVMRAGLNAMVRLVETALTKHEIVTVTNEIGNHDDHTSVWLSLAMDAYFRNDDRVTVDLSPAKFHYYRHGLVLYGTTHGDTCKVSDLESIMATDRKEDWGETRYRHWYTGHVHHDSVKDMRACTVETLRTLAARDQWAHASGYRGDRDMKCDVWSCEDGRVQRNIVNIEQVKRWR